MALLSEEFFSPEDRPSLLALCALSEVSDEGVLLPTHIQTFSGSSRLTFLPPFVVFETDGSDTNRKWLSIHETGAAAAAVPPAGSVETRSDAVLKCVHVQLTPLTVGALVGLGFASFAVGRGGGVRGGAGAAAVFLFHRG